MGGDVARLLTLLLLISAVFMLSRPYLCALIISLWLVLSYCKRVWWTPRLDEYVQRFASQIRQALGAGDLSNAILLISRLAWVRLFGYHALILELTGQHALGMGQVEDAVAYFNRALMNDRGHEGLDAHFGILQARLLQGDRMGVQKKVDELRRRFEGDAFVDMRIELLTQPSS